MTIEVILTDLAAARGGQPAKQKAAQEIEKMLNDGLACLEDLIFHYFEVDEVGFICYPKDGKLEVDTCYDDKLDKALDREPLKGYHITIPRGDSGRDPL